MNRQRTLLTISVVMLFPVLSASAQDRKEPTVPLSMAKQIEFRDSVRQAVRAVSDTYQASLDSIFSDTALDGKQQWQKINELTMKRNLQLRQLSDRLKLNYPSISKNP